MWDSQPSQQWKNFFGVIVLQFVGHQDFPAGSDGKASAYNVGDPGSIPRWRRSSGAAASLCLSTSEEVPHIQGKRNPNKTVGVLRGSQRADTLKSESHKTSQSDHMENSLV